MGDLIRVDFRAPRRPRPPPVPDPLALALSVADAAACAGWAAWVATARVWLIAGLMVLDAAERGPRR